MRTSLALSALLLLVCGVADASWIREYDRGLQAVKQEDWAEAERRFAAAIREDAVPQARRRFQGAVFRPYVPHFYAGLAAYRRGDCQTAMQYWSHAPTVDVLAGLQDERNERQSGVNACQSRLAQTQPARPAEPAPTTPAVARTEPPSATPTRPPPSTPPSSGTGSAQTVPAQPGSVQPDRSTATAQAPPRTAPETAPVTRPTAPAPASAPQALRSAVDAWLAGRYADLLRLEAGAAADARSRAQLHLFRAAAAHVLAEQAGQAEGSGLDNARSEVRAARAAQSSLQPDEVLFSPRFRRFWQQTR